MRRESSVRQGIRSVTQVPSWIYQRYSQVWRRTAVSAGWAVLYALFDNSLAQYGPLDGSTFPVQWRAFFVACIFFGGLWKPVVGYALFVAAIAYPMYLVSVYLMALALALLLLSAPLAARYLPLALIVIGAPAIAPLHLTPVIPLLLGLLSTADSPGGWGRTGSALSAGLCALWLKICAGMTGYTTDLWYINGWTLDLAPVYERFHTANSLQTLVRLVDPLILNVGGSAASILLFNLLQVCTWAGAAYVVGALRELLLSRNLGRAGRGSAWTSVLSLVPGMILIWAGYVIVPSWLQVPGPRWTEPLWLPAQVVLAAVVAVGISGLLRYLRQPLLARQQAIRVSVPSAPPWRWRGRAKRKQSQSKASDSAASRIIGQDVRDRQTGGDSPTRRRRDGDSDIIMIELD